MSHHSLDSLSCKEKPAKKLNAWVFKGGRVRVTYFWNHTDIIMFYAYENIIGFVVDPGMCRWEDMI